MRQTIYTIILCNFMLIWMCCGTKPYVDPILAPYVHQFEQASCKVSHCLKVDNIDVFLGTDPSVQEGDPNIAVLGYCEYAEAFFGRNSVHINTSLITNGEEWQKEYVMFHELGHCQLGRKHITYLMSDGSPQSIMYPYLIQYGQYIIHRDEYIYELFNAYQEN